MENYAALEFLEAANARLIKAYTLINDQKAGLPSSMNAEVTRITNKQTLGQIITNIGGKRNAQRQSFSSKTQLFGCALDR